MTFEFCPKCGERLVLKPIGDEGEVECAGWFSLDEARELLSRGTVGKDLLRDYLSLS
ncbi:MAG: hypothetical protein KIG62_01910 [Oscillospiraceae bacterium]|nr:hypothetical protein [Oscillospiraceae bacterium]